jgi:hypothetical protein
MITITAILGLTILPGLAAPDQKTFPPIQIMPGPNIPTALPDLGQPADVIVFVPKEYREDRADFGRAAAAELISYADLKDNWDGEGAVAPRNGARENALAMLEAVPLGIEAPKTMVMADGDVALYWERGDVFAEIGFDGSEKFYAYATAPGMPDVHLDEIAFKDERGNAKFPDKVAEILNWDPLLAAA